MIRGTVQSAIIAEAEGDTNIVIIEDICNGLAPKMWNKQSRLFIFTKTQNQTIVVRLKIFTKELDKGETRAPSDITCLAAR